jgi:hypothetical protein
MWKRQNTGSNSCWLYSHSCSYNSHNMLLLYFLQHFRFHYCIIRTCIALEAKDAGNVYRVLLEVLMESCVPLDRIIGICSDGASTMMGCYRGVCTRLAQHVRALRADTMLLITGNGSDIRQFVGRLKHFMI